MAARNGRICTVSHDDQLNLADHNLRPRVVLICQLEDRFDVQGLSAWMASSMSLAGVVLLRESRGARLRRAVRELHRSGLAGLLDVLAFRLCYRLGRARRDRDWVQRAVAELRVKYRADTLSVPRVVTRRPDSEEAREFLKRLRPDLVIARCKYILPPRIFSIPSAGTFVLHPGICPEYRNAHGCFWALVRGDYSRVGMTLLKVDEGVDTGPVYFHGTYPYDPRSESHIVIQYRAVMENLDRIAMILRNACLGRARPIAVDGRASAMWGQPRLSAYLRWRYS